MSEKMGIVNAYICSSLHTTVTVNMNEGVTSFIIQCRKCAAKGINNMAKSLMYQVDQKLQPELEFYKPTAEDWKDLYADISNKKTVDTMMAFVEEKNGLLIRERKGLKALQEVTVLSYETFLFDAHRWAKETFFRSTAKNHLLKLIEEAREAIDCFETKNGGMKDELADIFICLAVAIGEAGYRFENILFAAADKMQKNKRREWIYDSVNMVYKHIARNR